MPDLTTGNILFTNDSSGFSGPTAPWLVNGWAVSRANWLYWLLTCVNRSPVLPRLRESASTMWLTVSVSAVTETSPVDVTRPPTQAWVSVSISDSATAKPTPLEPVLKTPAPACTSVTAAAATLTRRR